MTNKELDVFVKDPRLPLSLIQKINDVLNEDDNYVADELVNLCEEILVQTAAIGIAAYLSQPNQKQVFNDFILQLFTNKTYSYNAGPLYRWAANMIKGLDDKISKKLHPLFWKNGELNQNFERLSKLRNEVMHGFFILPAKRNIEEAKHISKVLKDLIRIDIFHIYSDSPYHFFSKEKDLVFFNNNWNISTSQWSLFDKSYAFGKLTQDIIYELSQKFIEDQFSYVEKNTNHNKPIDSVIDFIESNQQGSFAVWSNPNYPIENDYCNLIKHLNENEYLKIFYNLDPHGINTTEDFLLRYIYNSFKPTSLSEIKSIKKLKKEIIKLNEETSKKTVVIINNIHTSLFKQDYLLNLKDFLFENKILLIAFGQNYPWLNQFFNKSYFIDEFVQLPKKNEIEKSLNNYLRYKGPNIDIEDEKKDYLKIKEILFKVIDELKKEKLVLARKYADKNKYPIEFIFEVFAILNPFFRIKDSAFEIDQIDGLTNFPSQINESSRIFFCLERRDIKLEYKHKKIAL